MFIFIFYIVPIIVLSVVHYKDESIKTVGEFLGSWHWFAIFMPVINFLITMLIPISYIVRFIFFKLHLREVFTVLMNKRIK